MINTIIEGNKGAENKTGNAVENKKTKLITVLAVGCRMLRIDTTTLKDMTIGKIGICLNLFGDGAAIEDVYEDLSDCIGVKKL